MNHSLALDPNPPFIDGGVFKDIGISGGGTSICLKLIFDSSSPQGTLFEILWLKFLFSEEEKFLLSRISIDMFFTDLTTIISNIIEIDNMIIDIIKNIANIDINTIDSNDIVISPILVNRNKIL